MVTHVLCKFFNKLITISSYSSVLLLHKRYCFALNEYQVPFTMLDQLQSKCSLFNIFFIWELLIMPSFSLNSERFGKTFFKYLKAGPFLWKAFTKFFITPSLLLIWQFSLWTGNYQFGTDNCQYGVTNVMWIGNY